MNQSNPGIPVNSGDVSLTDLMRHIVDTHHAYCREELPRLDALIKAAVDRHSARRPELRRIQALFDRMSKDLSMHLLKEEETLFPYIAELEERVRLGTPSSWPRFGTVETPIRLLVEDHQHTDGMLEAMRRLRGDLSPLDSGAAQDPDFAALIDGFTSFERDMREHIHAEDDLLFPRAIALERAACTRA